MLTFEDALYHKMLLEAGVTGELAPVIDRLLVEEEPLSEVALRLAYCKDDPNEQLSALNEYLSEVPFEGIDTDSVFEPLREYCRKEYEDAPDDLGGIADLMYRISLSSEREHEEPWQQLWMLGDCYDLVEIGVLAPEEFRERLTAFLYRGEFVYPRVPIGRKFGILDRIRELLNHKRK